MACRPGLLAVVVFWLCVVSTQAGSITLVADGRAKCCIVSADEKSFEERDTFNWTPKTPFLKWAAEDLAGYIGKMGGVSVPVADQPVEGLLPILLGADPLVPKTPTPYGDAYVISVATNAIALKGESRRAVYYAAVDFLYRLGVRWYAPTEMGEVVPQRKTITVETGGVECAPDFATRRLWCRPPDELRWMYRNRLGDATIPAGHSLHGYAAGLPGWKDGKEGRSLHPEYYSVVNGTNGMWINLANPEVVRVVAGKAVESLQEEPRSGAQGGKKARGFISISPDDGFLQDERPEVVAMNSPGREPVLGMPSFSDAWFGFLTRVCAEVDRQAPGLDFKFGSLAYMNYILPPKKARPDPRIVPVIAPITLNRFVSMNTAGAPASDMLEPIVKGWIGASPRVGVYLYNFNLADMAMPYTRRLHWTKDIPRFFTLGIRDMCIESHPNWHTMMPGNYVAARLLWDTKTDITAELNAFYPDYYGSAASAMRRYDTTLENAYESTKVYAGGVWGMHRILTTSVMKELEEALLDAEKQAAGEGVFEDRVKVARFSLNFAKIWFAARDAMNRGDFAEAEDHGTAFVANYRDAYARYPVFFGKNVSWSPNIERYFELFHSRALTEAGRIAREGVIVCRIPDELSTCLEPVEAGVKPSGKAPDPEHAGWKPMKTYSSTLDEQGLPFFRGVIWHRFEFDLSADVKSAKSFRLWFGGVDSKVRGWLNGQDIGEQFAGSFRPVEFDVSAALEPEKNNLLVIAVDNTFPNEVGVGGIMRPVVIYSPRPATEQVSAVMDR